MIFTPLTKEQIQERNLAQPGDYRFTIDSCDERVQGDRSMFKIKFKFKDLAGRDRFVYDNILSSFEERLRNFCECIGILNIYETGKLMPSDIIGRSGTFTIVISPPQADKKDPSKIYPAQNRVQKYLFNVEPPQGGLIDEDVPF